MKAGLHSLGSHSYIHSCICQNTEITDVDKTNGTATKQKIRTATKYTGEISTTKQAYTPGTVATRSPRVRKRKTI